MFANNMFLTAAAYTWAESCKILKNTFQSHTCKQLLYITDMISPLSTSAWPEGVAIAVVRTVSEYYRWQIIPLHTSKDTFL